MNGRKCIVVCTLGPASLVPSVLRRWSQQGVGLLRVNLSHVTASELPAIIDTVRANCPIPICIDTAGPQLRVGSLAQPVELQAGTTWEPSGATSFRPAEAVAQLRTGDLLSIAHRSVLARVCASGQAGLTLEILQGGRIGSNKAVSVNRPLDLPLLSERDLEAIEIAGARGVLSFAVSFAGCGADIAAVRRLVGPRSQVIAKVESTRALDNLDELLTEADAVWIDRGDLSEAIPRGRVPELQARVLARAGELKAPVYIATDILASMADSSQPTQAELSDVLFLLSSGAQGLVLAAETAVGVHPVPCASTLLEMVDQFEQLDGESASPSVTQAHSPTTATLAAAAAPALPVRARATVSEISSLSSALVDALHREDPRSNWPARFEKRGSARVAGDVGLVGESMTTEFMGPADFRWILSRRAWSCVAGVATYDPVRDLVTGLYERMLEMINADVLIVALRTTGDAARGRSVEDSRRLKAAMLPHPLLRSGRVLLGAPPIRSQPESQDMMLVATVMKNLGCTDVVFDRSHTESTERTSDVTATAVARALGVRIWSADSGSVKAWE